MASSPRGSWRDARAAQQCSHPAAELAHRERLRDVVVGAELEAEHLVDSSSRAVSMMIGTVLRARRRLQTSRPSSPGSIRSSTTRSAALLREGVERLLAVARLHDPVTVALERVAEQLLHGFLVVHEEDGRGVGHVRRACRAR